MRVADLISLDALAASAAGPAGPAGPALAFLLLALLSGHLLRLANELTVRASVIQLNAS